MFGIEVEAGLDAGDLSIEDSPTVADVQRQQVVLILRLILFHHFVLAEKLGKFARSLEYSEIHQNVRCKFK